MSFLARVLRNRNAPIGNPDDRQIEDRFRRSGDPRIDHENSARRTR